jgi:hypothetical protein
MPRPSVSGIGAGPCFRWLPSSGFRPKAYALTMSEEPFSTAIRPVRFGQLTGFVLLQAVCFQHARVAALRSQGLGWRAIA